MSTRRIKVLWEPNKGPQTAFLASTAREVLYGGAAGGGKTDSLMMLPLYRIHNPKHRSILFRRTRPQLQEVIDRQQLIYPLIDPGCRFVDSGGKCRWEWSSGAITQMGFMEHEADRMKFKTFEYDMVLFDELTSFTKKMYLFLFSRNRSKDLAMPAVMRGGTNPGDEGHQWVFDRFIANREPYHVYEEQIDASDVHGIEGMDDLRTTIQFIPAKLADNPKMPDRQSYIAGLKIMGEEGDAYLHGDWSTFSGQMFRQPIRVGPPLPWSPGAIVVRSFDYGFGDPLCIHWARAHRSGMIEFLDEVYSPEMTVDAIQRRVNEVERQLQIRPTLSVGGQDMFAKRDTGGVSQSIADMLTNRGIWVEKANNDHQAGFAKLQRLLAAGKFYVREGKCPNLIRTLPNLVRDPNKPNDLKPRQEDHAQEAARYAVMAVPESDTTAEAGYSAPVIERVEADPVYRRIMEGLQREREGVNFPGMEN